MATLAEIQSAIADLQTTASTIDSGLDAVKTEIDALKAQVAAGGAVSEADLDGVLGSLQGVQTTLADAMTKESGL